MRSWMIAFFSGWLIFMLSGHWWHQLETFVSLPVIGLLILFGAVVLFHLPVKLRIQLIVFLSGVLLAGGVLFRIAHPFTSADNGALFLVEGRICADSASDHTGRDVQKILFCLSSIQKMEALTPAINTDTPPDFSRIKKLLLSCYYCLEPLQPGRDYQLEIRLKLTRPLQNFNQLWAWQNAWNHPWQARGTIRKVISSQIHQNTSFVVWDLVKSIRRNAAQVYEAMTFATSIDALLFGSRKGLSSQEWEILRNSGLTHLMVISGLHISLVAGFLFGVTNFLAKSLKRQHRLLLASLMSAAGVSLFICLIDYGIPAIRAALGTFAGIAFLLGRQRWQMSSVLVAVLLLCGLLDSLSVFGVGFWLSFAGVSLLLVLFGNRRKVELSKVRGLWKSQVGFMLGLGGLLIVFFGQLPMVSIIGNIIAVPLVCLVILPTGLIAMLVNTVSAGLGALLFALVNQLFGYFWYIADMLSTVPMLDLSQFRVALGLLMLIPGAVALIHLRFPLLVWYIPLIALVAFNPVQPAQDDSFFIEMLDVGQGEAVLIHQGRYNLLYDTGPGFEGWNAGKEVVVPRLNSLGIYHLDQVIISHGDMDHAGGLASLRELVPIDQLLSGEPDRVQGSELCRRGSARLGEISIEVLWPVNPREKVLHSNANNHSCVVMISYQGLKVLLTGDIEITAQVELLKINGSLLDADILILPHHGSKNAFSPQFLAAVSPRVTLVPTGYGNQFGHPHAVFRQWLEPRSVQLFNTAVHGAVRIDDAGLEESGHYRQWRITTARPYLDEVSFYTYMPPAISHTSSGNTAVQSSITKP